ncbi:metal-dependent transcriptional regulator [Deinococcus cellulosilyticus]|uniref:Manganese transport regulator n=1 Tax=Deinococcus cellulosilyticus (strain DSM 18568 / NBRC 106333 / KACC 11606 / 5516J-15) TaxID=1223518 RepID=A0A511NBR1_DEIC1|nr:metal-dependent transcriptional regulator [Deinococcus cellulosilyticus]GEM50006.1 DNA-binding protein [Deinococcus cellulosilyticus NBRC 106333 = KACC 11606]
MSRQAIRDLLTSQAEDYLKTIYQLARGGKVTTQSLADALGVTPASVSGMLRKLSDLSLVEHTPYYGAILTESGQKVALEILRHHRLLELYLTQALGFSWDEVHEEADRLEHVISEAFEARISALLGDPHFDPHGHPIPRLDGSMPEHDAEPLTDVLVDEQATISRVHDGDPEFLRYLSERGLTPGVELRMLKKDTHGGTVSIQVGEQDHVLSLTAAQKIWVLPRHHSRS